MWIVMACNGKRRFAQPPCAPRTLASPQFPGSRVVSTRGKSCSGSAAPLSSCAGSCCDCRACYSITTRLLWRLSPAPRLRHWPSPIRQPDAVKEDPPGRNRTSDIDPLSSALARNYSLHGGHLRIARRGRAPGADVHGGEDVVARPTHSMQIHFDSSPSAISPWITSRAGEFRERSLFGET